MLASKLTQMQVYMWIHFDTRDLGFTVDAQIFVGTIFRGLNFRGDKFSWVVVAHENLTPTKNYLL